VRRGSPEPPGYFTNPVTKSLEKMSPKQAAQRLRQIDYDLRLRTGTVKNTPLELSAERRVLQKIIKGE
jgi:hypothetical protein